MKKHIIGGLSAAVLSLSMLQAAPVYAMHKEGHMKDQCMMKKIDLMKEKLALTPEQEKQLQAIKERSKRFMENKHKEKHMIREEANRIADAKDIDKMKLDRLAERAGRLQGDILKHRVMTKHAIGQILTPKQKEMIKQDMHMKMHMMKKDMMQNNMPH